MKPELRGIQNGLDAGNLPDWDELLTQETREALFPGGGDDFIQGVI
jgi:hypothetical protein